MSKNIFISSLLDDFSGLEKIIPFIKESLTDCNLLVFLPSSKEYYEGQDEWEEKFIKQLKTYGIVINENKSPRFEHSASDWQEWVKQADLIYLHGGNPLVQKELYQKKRIYDLLRNYEGLLLGASAGAMNMSEQIVLTPTNEKYQEFVIEPGLALAPLNVYPHMNFNHGITRFLMTGDGLVDVLDLLKLSDEVPIHLLADGQFIVSNGTMNVISEPVLIASDGKLFYDGSEVILGWEHLLPIQYDGMVYEFIDYFDSWEDVQTKGLMYKWFNIELEGQRIFRSQMKFFAMTEEFVAVWQVKTNRKWLFVINHPHLLTCTLKYENQEDQTIKETLVFKTIFTQKVEQGVIINNIMTRNI